jgi:hypothetical protein
MTRVLFRLTLLVLGLALGEMGMTSFASSDPAWLAQLGTSIGLIVAGSAGFMQPLLWNAGRKVGTND